jgi:CHAT domain-containing protein
MPVDDRATAILMFKFYENVVLDRQPPARALRHAQIWLRDATGHKLALMAHQMLDRSTREAEPPGFRRWAERQMQPERRDAKPYNHPAYWSAFYHVGV